MSATIATIWYPRKALKSTVSPNAVAASQHEIIRAQKRLKRRPSGLVGCPAWVRVKLAGGLNSCAVRSATPESCHYVYEDVALVIAVRGFHAIAVSCSVKCCIAVNVRFRCCCISLLFDGRLQRHETTNAANWDHDCNQIMLISPPITWNYCYNNNNNSNRTALHLKPQPALAPFSLTTVCNNYINK